MVISLRSHLAGSKKSLEYCLKKYPQQKQFATELISMIIKSVNLTKHPKILEIGAAQGSFIIACKELGYDCEGIEPSSEAITVSKQLQNTLRVKIDINKGVGEYLPYKDQTFNLVVALSVLEHVKDVEKVLFEIFRILKPNGAFYFETTSSLCPMQGEIRFFPFFSWYPDKLKKKIMIWSINNRPSLIGYSDAPALNWFTPWKLNRIFKKAGFQRIIDRWDLLELKEFPPIKNHILKIINLTVATKPQLMYFFAIVRILQLRI